MAIEQLIRLDDGEHRVRPCADAPLTAHAQNRSRSAPRRHERDVGLRDLEARLGERHLEVLDERAEERPFGVEAPQPGEPLTLEAVGVEGRATAVPGGEQAAILRPGEDPGDRAERLQLAGRRRLGP